MSSTPEPGGPERPEHSAAAEDGRDLPRQPPSRPARGQLVVAVLLALLGFAAVTQIRSSEDASSYSGLREQDLIDVLDGLAGSTQRARAEIDELTRLRQQLQSESTQRRAALEQAQDEVDDLSVLAGLVAVTGPGIRVTVNEETGTVPVSTFVDVIQELRTVDAEAIQINGLVRVVAQSSFESAEGGLLIDGELVESPYVVDAIGTPSALSGAIDFFLGPRDELERIGASVEVDELPSLDIDTVREPVEPEFAEPAP